jgi:hypothetical protein
MAGPTRTSRSEMTQPEELLRRWMLCVNERDVEGLLQLYSEDAVLIPTFSNRMLSTPERIRGYFEMLCSREDLSISLREKTTVVQRVADALHLFCGIYSWRFAVDGEVLNFEARFSYFTDFAPGRRPILHHHSSQIPRML